MDIIKTAKAGTFESNDIYVVLAPNQGIKIEIESPVMAQFGDRIREVIEETLRINNVKNVYIKAQDKGALDFTIRARIETALNRAAK
ncbi:MAG: citrate lyase acyl carrier protein [Bacillota bacterium]|nr:citrate lyase acyl carrier protein [Bacillota bacterium]